MSLGTKERKVKGQLKAEPKSELGDVVKAASRLPGITARAIDRDTVRLVADPHKGGWGSLGIIARCVDTSANWFCHLEGSDGGDGLEFNLTTNAMGEADMMGRLLDAEARAAKAGR